MSQTPLPQIRIDGVVTYSPDLSEKEALELIKTHLTNLFQGKIEVLNPDSESYMVSVERHVLQSYKDEIHDLRLVALEQDKRHEKNQELFIEQSKQLSKAEEEKELWQKKFNKSDLRVTFLTFQLNACKKRLELKESTRWKTFVKWVKSLWQQH